MRILSLIATILSTAAGCVVPQYSANRTEVEVITPERLASLDVSTFNGSVSVESFAGDSVELEVTYRARGNSEQEAEENCSMLGREIDAEGDRVIIRATRPSGIRNSSVAFKIKAPRHCSLELKTSNGAISAKDFEGGVSATTSNGSVSMTKITEYARVNTSNGVIRVKNVSGNVDLSTSNGKVYLSGMVAGPDNKIRTSNGAVEVELDCEQTVEVAARASNGKVRCSADEQRILDESKKSIQVVVGQGDVQSVDAKLTIRTSNGSVKIGTMESSDAEMNLEVPPTTEGEVSSDADIAI